MRQRWNIRGTPTTQPWGMNGVRYRAYLVRTWRPECRGADTARVWIEWIAKGSEVEIRGGRAADLVVRIEEAFGPEAACDAAEPVAITDPVSKGGAGWTK